MCKRTICDECTWRGIKVCNLCKLKELRIKIKSIQNCNHDKCDELKELLNFFSSLK